MNRNIQQRLRRFAALTVALLFALAFAACGDESSGSNTGGGDTPAAFMTMIGKAGGKDVTITITHTDPGSALSAYVPASGDFYTVLYQGVIIDKGKVNVPAGGAGSAVFTPAVTGTPPFSITLNNWTVTNSTSIVITRTVGSPGTISVTISSVNNGSSGAGLDGKWLGHGTSGGTSNGPNYLLKITGNTWEGAFTDSSGNVIEGEPNDKGVNAKGTLSVSGSTITKTETDHFMALPGSEGTWEKVNDIETFTLAPDRLSFTKVYTYSNPDSYTFKKQ